MSATATLTKPTRQKQRDESTWRPALEHANQIRFARARFKRRLKHGDVTLRDAFADPCMQSMLVYDLLASLPGQNKAKRSKTAQPTMARAQAKKIVRKSGLFFPETLTVRNLSPITQRGLMAAAAEIPHLRAIASVETETA